jgi:hypothetical protein
VFLGGELGNDGLMSVEIVKVVVGGDIPKTASRYIDPDRRLMDQSLGMRHCQTNENGRSTVPSSVDDSSDFNGRPQSRSLLFVVNQMRNLGD